MRWTIPTLMQQLVDQGVSIDQAMSVVADTYPTTRGDTFYRGPVTDSPLSPAVGVYGLWNGLRGDQSPLGGTKVSDDARTIAQFLRLDNRDLGKIVYLTPQPDKAVDLVALKTAAAMRAGDYFAPVQVDDDDPTPHLLDDLHRAVARSDGAADYITSIPLPHFGQ
jgi:hypothetical protein